MRKITTYTGIGSRKTPKDILSIMVRFGVEMARKGIILRSGGANGADAAFEAGCDAENGQKQIFLPWRGFNDHPSKFYTAMDEAYEIASRLHPAWNRCQQAAQKLHARNCHQILGPHLDDPSGFVVCWTPDGNVVGGTATAINLAQERGIKVFNMAIPSELAMVEEIIERYAA
jgi:hypothetical protein